MNKDKQHNKDFHVFQQDSFITNGLDEPQQLNYENLTDFMFKPAKIGETIKCKITSLNRVLTV
jgi:hypothetical protein